MARSHWKLHLNAKTDISANKIVNKCIKAIGRLPIESNISPYSKGGYMATLQLYHDENLQWSELVIEVINLSQSIGSGWCMFGQIDSSPSAVLSKESSCSHISISGLLWAEWQVINE